MVNREKVVKLRLLLTPYLEVGVFELDLVVVQLDFFADVLDEVELLVEEQVVERADGRF